jgi:pimeloyl-ACP methyl ester carboxylesterase
MTERMVAVPGAELCVDTHGDPGDPAVLLIHGAAASMDGWDPEFCARLAAAGRYVVRYDHRDTGRSSTCPPGRPDYTVDDLTVDPLRILDALDITDAHLVGVSMGGGIAQQLAALHPDRVRTLTLIATSCGGDRIGTDPLPPPTTSAEPPEPSWDDRDAVLGYLVDSLRTYAGALFDTQRAHREAVTTLDRARDIAAAANHWLVIGDDGVSFAMTDIKAPTLVLHGTDDPLFPPAHGVALAAEIPGAQLVELPGMGHEAPPPQLWDVVVPAIVRQTSSGKR